jgi:hypothetical protein
MDEGITSCPTALVDVLPLVIQHSSISKQLGSVCSLLCTSQQTAQAVMHNCVGRLNVRVQTSAQIAINHATPAWLAKHWRLIRSFSTSAGFGDPAWVNATEKALADAAAG